MFKHFIMGFLCTLYILSPVDLLPEAFLGPLGLPDDLIAALIAWHQFRQAFQGGKPTVFSPPTFGGKNDEFQSKFR